MSTTPAPGSELQSDGAAVAPPSPIELGLPVRTPAPGLPERVQIWEVGPRDGLQNERDTVPADVKIEFVRRLASSGLPIVETTSMVHPKWVPQLADAAEVLDGVLADARDGVSYPVLVPNERGLDRAAASGVRDIAIFASATETFAMRNLNRGLDEQFAMFEPVVRRAVEQGLWVRGYLSMCFGDPWEGPVEPEQVARAARRLADMGCAQIAISDTIGVATAGQVRAVLGAVGRAGIEPSALGVHFHDTYGQALSNSLAAIADGVTTVDASAGGLGGCPFAGSATGNLATEDLVWALTGLGIEHEVDLPELAATSAWMAGKLGRPSPSAVVRALTG